MVTKYEVLYIEEIYKDFKNADLSEERVLNIDKKMHFIADSPWNRTEKVENTGERTLRKTRFGTFRMFVDIDDGLLTLTGLAFLPRNKCYKKRQKTSIISLLRNNMENKQEKI
jgi:mRNA-degrading endonuclease RelE of RelBE toxin-antitoxin system